jgi:hypothetical protein
VEIDAHARRMGKKGTTSSHADIATGSQASRAGFEEFFATATGGFKPYEWAER